MEVKPYVAPLPAPAPVMPAAIAPMPMPMPLPAPMPAPYHDHVHLHTSYKHTSILMPEMAPVYHAPVVAPYTSTASILVLFILLVIITRSFFRQF